MCELYGQLSDKELINVYQRTKVVCLPSTYEGVGLSAMEGLANGAKVLITSVGGTRDYFSSSATFVHNPYQNASIVKALKSAQYKPYLSDIERIAFVNKYSEFNLSIKLSEKSFFKV